MATPKDIRIEPISSRDAAALVKRVHYSGKICNNSQLHLGAFLDGKLEGVMSFGASMDKRRMVGLVRDTAFHDFLELNRMAFTDRLPRNSESRALSVAMRLIRKHYPNVEWVISFADGAQCGDGTIYRASGFHLIQINRNKTLLRMPDGSVVADKALNNKPWPNGMPGASYARQQGARPLDGFQLKYIYFLNPSARERLTVPVLPFSALDDAGARMYKGKKQTRVKDQALEYPSSLGGETPTHTLHS